MREFYKLIIPYLKGKTLLDIGCGSCRDIDYFSSLGFECECIEPSKEFRKICLKKFPKLKIYDQKLPNIRINKKYDVITLIAVWMHLKKYEYEKVVKKIKRLLNENATVIISYSISKREGFEFINPKQIKYLFIKNGFDLKKEKIFKDSLNRKISWVTQIYFLDKIT
jgi:cyclopropane fatty-acyl-phospholipid synthase-like methyltransferase